jgi:hypothetical protein
MVLRPLGSYAAAASAGAQTRASSGDESSEEFQPAWEVVLARQLQPAPTYWLITQPDHAVLAGDLAAHFSSSDFPQLKDEVLRAIRLHDAGWSELDNSQPRLVNGKPASFLEATTEEFVRAWTASIDAAERDSPLGGALVSRHFRRLVEMRAQMVTDSSEDARHLHRFLEQEQEREARLVIRPSKSRKDIEELVTLLQFCDLLSLYLCCGTTAAAEFPQRFGGRSVRVRQASGTFRLDPSPFASSVTVSVNGRRYPASEEAPNTTTISFVMS